MYLAMKIFDNENLACMKIDIQTIPLNDMNFDMVEKNEQEKSNVNGKGINPLKGTHPIIME